ncbi:MAG: 3-phosphoshikimate 1-carboxyvinyltransferase [Bacteroidales bacterium]|nr:3-phosphoshikimate 1-carboxyvinyltransferase [Bacteroidales bacterium]
MNIKICPSKIRGSIKAPPSKSIMQRVIASALFAKGTTIIQNPSFCDDTETALNIAEKLGATIIRYKNKIIITGGFNPKQDIINCKESGLCLRMFIPIVALHNSQMTLTGEKSLLKRPVSMIKNPLKELGVECKTNNGLVPVTIKGPINGNKIIIDGSLSSQLLTGFLIALPNHKFDTEIIVKNLKSKPYIDLTIQVLNNFGIEIYNPDYQLFNIKGSQSFQAIEYIIEGDWSGAAFILSAAALSGEVEITGLNINSKQADRSIIDVLQKIGATVITKQSSVKVFKNKLNSFFYDATHCPDLFPVLVVLASFCNGMSVIKGINRLIYKESNRADVLKNEFEKMGVQIKIDGDNMIIKGGEIKNGIINSFNDHRIVMAAAVTGVAAKEEIIINDYNCVSKSYPEFFKDFISIGGNVV